MSGASKKVSEEELQKQYADYRAQFEQWKENNKGSIGTEAYNSYVQQFEQWEKEVEARTSQQQKHRKAAAVDKEAEAAAAAYAQSQEAYMAHHLRGMEQTEMQKRAAAAAQLQQQQMMQNMMMQRPPQHQQPPPQDVMFGAVGRVAQGAPAAAPPPTQQPPPQLWGNNKPIYDARDPLFAKWGERAASAHCKPETEQQINPVACWLLLDALREKKMVLAPHSNTCPPPQIGGHQI
ncbi:SUppressor of Tau pathology [Caenorhabditis elegans]|uniref:SUppressor of Tau pathology n=1 Tax=Caenorhabditis elegans TaxID=6239 RepID=H2KYJ0_CAEEL|nr:SUppressor of Tau pathology [Caenorhabditis elegans]CCD63491.1 SUppressor of Tau pathology [Caenorhabditis elegans]|eukprot:NP_493917.2 SUppressor of Tau pathology [Caenorhabditis elegans]